MNDNFWELRQWLTAEEHEQMIQDKTAARDNARCTHDDGAIVVYQIYSNGSKRYHKQCKGCGETKMLAKSELSKSQINRASLKDNDLIEQLRQSQWEAMNYAAEQVELEYMHTVEARKFERRRNYENYLLSDEWQSKRKLVLNRCGGVCEGCGENKATQVHHKTYDRLFDEMLFDLVGVCESCHNKIHS